MGPLRVLYLDGLGANPTGRKPSRLREQGYDVIVPVLSEWDFDAALREAQEAFDAQRPDVVVGYSRGGALALNLATGDVPLVLLAPAWRFRGTADRVKSRAVILHAADDPLVPIDGSRELLQNSGLPESALVVVGEEHDMTDPQALQALIDAVESFRIGSD